MQKVLWAALVVLLAVSCGSPVTAGNPAPEKPLELNVDNLKGKWVLEGNSSVWVEFAADFTCKNSDNETGTYSITDSKTIKGSWKDIVNITTTRNHTIIIYKNYSMIDNRKYIKS